MKVAIINGKTYVQLTEEQAQALEEKKLHILTRDILDRASMTLKYRCRKDVEKYLEPFEEEFDTLEEELEQVKKELEKVKKEKRIALANYTTLKNKVDDMKDSTIEATENDFSRVRKVAQGLKLKLNERDKLIERYQREIAMLKLEVDVLKTEKLKGEWKK